MSHPPLIDHIGWELWQTSQGWKALFDREMAGRGFPWYGEAMGAVFRHIGRDGADQVGLANAVRASKQAVQQQVDALQSAGLIVRQPDPDDKRRNRIALSPKGVAALETANAVKQEIEARYAAALGAAAMADLRRALARIREIDLTGN